MLEFINSFLKPTKQLRDLQLLEEISRDPTLSQRKLSQRIGVALGVINACLKKMIDRRLIRVEGANHKRVAYYLTPEGISEKARLNYYFIQHVIGYYSALKNSISGRLSALSEAGHKRIICYGAGEVLETVFIILNETNLDVAVIGIVDDGKDKQGTKIFGLVIENPRVIKQLKPDAVLVTSIKYKDEIMERFSSDKELTGIDFYSL